jgi:hypothetical protein
MRRMTQAPRAPARRAATLEYHPDRTARTSCTHWAIESSPNSLVMSRRFPLCAMHDRHETLQAQRRARPWSGWRAIGGRDAWRSMTWCSFPCFQPQIPPSMQECQLRSRDNPSNLNSIQCTVDTTESYNSQRFGYVAEAAVSRRVRWCVKAVANCLRGDATLSELMPYLAPR